MEKIKEVLEPRNQVGRRELLALGGAAVLAGCSDNGNKDSEQDSSDVTETQEESDSEELERVRPELPHERGEELGPDYVSTHMDVVDDFDEIFAEFYVGSRTTGGYRERGEIEIEGDQVLGDIRRLEPLEEVPYEEVHFYTEGKEVLIEIEDHEEGTVDHYVVDPDQEHENTDVELARQLSQHENIYELMFTTDLIPPIESLEHALDQMPYPHSEQRENNITGELLHEYTWNTVDNNQYPETVGIEDEEITDFESLATINDNEGHISVVNTEYDLADDDFQHFTQMWPENIDVEKPGFANRAEASH